MIKQNPTPVKSIDYIKERLWIGVFLLVI
jgi:hypothetical protein